MIKDARNPGYITTPEMPPTHCNSQRYSKEKTNATSHSGKETFNGEIGEQTENNYRLRAEVNEKND